MAVSLETLLLAKQLAGGSGGGESGTTNYNQLSNKPSINGTTLQGNISLASIGALASSDITTIWTGTQAEYDLITPKDVHTLYFIKEE